MDSVATKVKEVMGEAQLSLASIERLHMACFAFPILWTSYMYSLELEPSKCWAVSCHRQSEYRQLSSPIRMP